METEMTSLRFDENIMSNLYKEAEEADMRSEDEKKKSQKMEIVSAGAQIGVVVENSATSSSSDREKIKDRDLYAAALKGNWKDAKALVTTYPELLHSKLTPGEDTVLHIATSSNHRAFVKKLVNLEKVDVDLTLRNKNGDTAFSIAVASGFIDIAQIMIRRKSDLPNLSNENGETPLSKAVKGGHKKMVRYLFPHTHIEQLKIEDRNRLFVATVMNEMYDISLVMLRKDSTLAFARDLKSNLTALHMLAQKPQGTASGSGVGTMITYIYSWIYGNPFLPTSAYQLLEKIWELVLKNLENEQILELICSKGTSGTPRVLFEAVKSRNIELVTLLVKSLPYLIHEVDEEGKRLSDVAISHRNRKIFKLIYNLGAFRDTTHIDDDGNNMLHLAAKSSPLDTLGISRPNLQLQRELLWFKEVEKMMSPAFINMKNGLGETPKDVFLKEHKELIIKARTAMKETAGSCMVVSTLISSIVFSAAFNASNVPTTTEEGYCSYNFTGSTETGRSCTYYTVTNHWFLIFVVSSVAALLTSTTSTIMLLSILTSLFVESDYIKSLRANMRWALNALFISIISMVIAFTAYVILIYDKYNVDWIPYFTVSLGIVPVILFIFLYLRLGMGRI